MSINNKKNVRPATRLRPLALCVALASPALPVFAFEDLSDSEMAQVSGQDGLTVSITGPTSGINISQVNWRVDKGTANEGLLSLQDLSIRGVDTNGVPGGSATLVTTMDTGAGSVIGKPYLNLELDTNRIRVRTEALRLGSDATRTLGTFAIDGDILLKLTGNGIFNMSATDTYLKGEITDGAIYYRSLWHQHPYLVLNNFDAKWEMEGGRLGVDADGIVMETGPGTASRYVNVKLDFDLLYKFPVHYGAAESQDFKITGNESPLLHFGWLGSMKDVKLVWRPGGVWSGYNTANKTAGLNFSSRWNFVNHDDAVALGKPEMEFRWQLGEAAREGNPAAPDKSRINFELSDWVGWGGAQYAHDFPLIALDVIKSGDTQGPGGLCWGNSTDGSSCAGGQFVNLTPGTISGYSNASVNRTNAESIALMVRDGQFRTFSRKIKLLERDAAGNLTNLVGGQARSFNWGLIFTLPNIDANAYLYAGNGDQGDTASNGGSHNRGIMLDLVLMTQSFADSCANPAVTNCSQGFSWDTGAHFMIADTDLDGDGTTGENRDAQGIGFISSNLLLIADDTRITPKAHWNAADLSAGGIDIMSPRFRLNFRGTFGGGVLPDASGAYGPKGQELIKGVSVALNLEGLMNFRISPAPIVANGPKNYIGFSGAFRFQDTDIAGFSESTAADTLDDGSFISLAEPSNASADLRFARITGDVAIVDGMLDMRGTGEDSKPGYAVPGDGKPKLVLAATVQFGATAAARMNDGFGGLDTGTYNPATAGQAFEIGRVEFGDKPLGRIVIPSGQLTSVIALKPIN